LYKKGLKESRSHWEEIKSSDQFNIANFTLTNKGNKEIKAIKAIALKGTITDLKNIKRIWKIDILVNFRVL
jgi:hypothetical protein